MRAEADFLAAVRLFSQTRPRLRVSKISLQTEDRSAQNREVMLIILLKTPISHYI